MSRIVSAMAFATGLAAVAWIGLGFTGSAGSSWIALAVTAAIAGVYLLGGWEIARFRADTAALRSALADTPGPLDGLGRWLERVPASLRPLVRLRIEGERVALPPPALTPYLVGLLVMLGMLGTFLGMVVTFQGTVFALEGSTDLSAIRAALAAPIKGLGLAFGTSVAGVAASAMLGLVSALSRRERMQAGRLLDTRLAAELRPFSAAHQREETVRALQAQAQALPVLVDRLQALMDGLDRRSLQLNEQLAGQQERFHREATAAYTGLAGDVGAALKDSLVASARLAGESIQPVVEAAMAGIALESTRRHQQQVDAAQAQLDGLAARFGDTVHAVAEAWRDALADHAQRAERQADRLDHALAGFTQGFEQRSGALLSRVSEAAAKGQAAQAAADAQRLQAWTGALEATAGTLRAEWRRVGEESLAQQRLACQALEQAAARIAQGASEHASRSLEGLDRLLAQSQALVAERIESEARWTDQHREHMDQMAVLWRGELAALRSEEAARGDAAVARLGELQSALAVHLTQLGAALEAPMARLMQTASEVPQAAAQVIGQLREEMTRLSERDNLAFEERAGLLADVSALLQSLNRASGDQRTAIESLVASATTVLDQAASRFADTLRAQGAQASDTAAQVAAGAVELASLGESFGHAVDLFKTANDQLVEGLRRVEEAMGRSMARSDEQLAYYVAQAREVIDLSISSQQGIVEDLRQLRGDARALVEGST